MPWSYRTTIKNTISSKHTLWINFSDKNNFHMFLNIARGFICNIWHEHADFVLLLTREFGEKFKITSNHLSIITMHRYGYYVMITKYLPCEIGLYFVWFPLMNFFVASYVLKYNAWAGPAPIATTFIPLSGAKSPSFVTILVIAW